MSRRLRVVQMVCGIAIGDQSGGSELFGLRLAERLDQQGFESILCALWRYDNDAERAWQRRLEQRGVAVYYGAPHRPERKMRQNLLAAALGCRRHLRALRPDIVNTHNEYVDLVGMGLRLSGAPGRMLRTSHNEREWPHKPPIFNQLVSRLHPYLFSAQVGVSQTTTGRLNTRRPLWRGARPGLYIPNGVDPEAVLAQRSGRLSRASLGVPEGAPLFGCVARLSRQKGLPHLIDAMPHVLRQLPEARLLIVGHGEEQPQLQAQIAALGLERAVCLLGPRADAIDCLSCFDVFVSSSLWEGLPTVVLEAMALEVPVVATAITGSRELVLDGQTGLLAPPQDPRALARAMLRQYVERERAQAMASAARQHAEQFSMRGAARRYEALYRELIVDRIY